jgi:ATP-dependent helicase IRC3
MLTEKNISEDSGIKLRDYQNECIDLVLNEHAEGVNRQLISLPTGSGKTVVMGALAKQINKKTILLAHREELIDQAVEKFKLVWPEVSIGICMADKDEIHAQVVIASVQSASRPKRLERLKEQGFELMMIDEAHHSVSDSYQNVINTLGFSNNCDKRLLIGVTATPMRSDKQGLGDTFEKITFSRSISTMIKAGYLSPVIGRKILTNFSMKGIRTNSGDFSITELAEAVNTPERDQFIVSKFKEYAANRKAVAFCCNVEHCQALAGAFLKEGVSAAAIWGDMPSIERKAVLENLKSGKLNIAISCGVLCEGFDEPTVNAIIMARPTKSSGLYIQCIGRGLRLWPDKSDCLVLDFADKYHNLDSVMSLTNTIPDAIQVKEALLAVEREEIDKTSKIEVIKDVDQEFDVVGNARFIWIPINNNEWSLQDDERNEIILHPKEKGYAAYLCLPDGSFQQIIKEPLPFEYASGVCEDFARKNLKIAFCDLNATWMNIPALPTQGQRDFLQKNGAYKNGMTKAEAGLEIRKIIAFKNQQKRSSSEPITQMQKYFLEGRGINTSNMSKMQAIQTISKLKQTEKAPC